MEVQSQPGKEAAAMLGVWLDMIRYVADSWKNSKAREVPQEGDDAARINGSSVGWDRWDWQGQPGQ